MLFFQDSVTLAALLAAADVEIEILPQPTSANSTFQYAVAKKSLSKVLSYGDEITKDIVVE